MEQFSLEKYLENPNRKVVTKDGRPVRIVCWDAKMESPIMALALNKSNNKEIALHYHVDGTYCPLMESGADLFFADGGEELTEFEKTMIQFSHERNSLIQFEHTTEEINAHLYLYSEELLNLARKEILKDLPKWKKAHEDKEFPLHVCVMDENMYPFLDTEANEGDYYIELSDLKILPKEE